MAIGEDTFLARAAAYFHDIGKLKNPNYYVENQTGRSQPARRNCARAERFLAEKAHNVWSYACKGIRLAQGA